MLLEKAIPIMIKVSVLHGNFYIWTAEDACQVRENHRIVGTLVGCLPRLPRQNIHLGLPLQLSYCEARLLFDRGFAQLFDESTVSGAACVEQIEAFKASRERLYQEQLEACKEARQQMMMKNFEKIVQGKKKKLQAEAAAAAAESQMSDEPAAKKGRRKMARNTEKSSNTCCSDAADEVNDSNIEEMVRQQIENESTPASLPAKAVCIQIHTANTERRLPDDANAISEWNFPKSARDDLLYQVFSHFWEKGYYLTAGGKFGGDFLVYPGDPSRFHSFFIVVCVDHTRQLSALELVALGRLGTGVKKTAVLCSVDDKGQVCCISLKWTGIS